MLAPVIFAPDLAHQTHGPNHSPWLGPFLIWWRVERNVAKLCRASDLGFRATRNTS